METCFYQEPREIFPCGDRIIAGRHWNIETAAGLHGIEDDAPGGVLLRVGPHREGEHSAGYEHAPRLGHRTLRMLHVMEGGNSQTNRATSCVKENKQSDSGWC